MRASAIKLSASRVSAIGAAVDDGALVYAEPSGSQLARGTAAALRELRTALGARGFDLVDEGGFHFRVRARSAQPPMTCACCGYRVAYGCCQRCGTRQSPPAPAEAQG